MPNYEKLRYEIYISEDKFGRQKAEELAEDMQKREAEDRVGTLLRLNINIVKKLADNGWGRKPRS